MGEINNGLNVTKTKLLDSSVDKELKPWQMNNAKENTT